MYSEPLIVTLYLKVKHRCFSIMHWMSKGVAALGVGKLRNEELDGVIVSLRVIPVDVIVVAPPGVDKYSS